MLLGVIAWHVRSLVAEPAKGQNRSTSCSGSYRVQKKQPMKLVLIEPVCNEVSVKTDPELRTYPRGHISHKHTTQRHATLHLSRACPKVAFMGMALASRFRMPTLHTNKSNDV